MLNHALHLIAITQLRYPTTEGRGFYERKLAEGKTKKEAILTGLHAMLAGALDEIYNDETALLNRLRLIAGE